jgi:hypothetical protein
MATSYSIDALDNFLREELPRVIHESLPEIAPVYDQIKRTSIGVEKGKIGRDWQVEHLYSTGLAGLMQSADVRGPLNTDNATYLQSTMLSSGFSIFPTATAAPHTSSLKRVLTLQMATGNFSIPVTWLSGDALPSSQIKQVVRDIKAVGQLRALTEAQSFFMSSDNALCQIDDWVATNEASGYATFTVKEGTGSTQFFRIGMMVDIYYNNAGAPNWGTTGGTNYVNCSDTGIPGSTNYIPLIVSDVDYLSGVITVASTGAESIAVANVQGDAAADDDWIVLRECGTVSGREMRTWGLEDWMKSSGQIMGGAGSAAALDLDTYSQFKSKVVTVSGPLTDTVMNGYVGGFLNAYAGSTLDTILTTMGVTLKYLEQPNVSNNRLNYDRTGKALDMQGGWSDIGYSFQGKNMKWMICPMAIGGRLYAIKLGGDNIRRYSPPAIGGSDGRIGGDIEFLAPLAGNRTIFKISHASSGASQAILEAPFWQYGLCAPLDVRGVLLKSLTEATMG